VRRVVGTIVFGGVALYFASGGGSVGLVAVVVAYIVGAASVALGPAWLGEPGKLPPRYGVAAAGSALGLIVAGAAAALGVPAVGLVFAGVMSAFVGGVSLGLVLIRFPDAQGRRP
jgi:hypothetical protein